MLFLDNLVYLPYIVERQVNQAEWFLGWTGGLDVLHGKGTAPYPYCCHFVVTVVYKGVE